MSDVVERAAQAVNRPEVQEMIRKLSELGLGVYALHEHSNDGEFIPLAANRVAVESDLKISFHDRNETGVFLGTPVGWAWIDGSVKPIAGCRGQGGSGHN
jgi:hypothetical protein